MATYSYNALDQMTSVSVQTADGPYGATYGYNGEGMRTSITQTAGTGGPQTYYEQSAMVLGLPQIVYRDGHTHIWSDTYVGEHDGVNTTSIRVPLIDAQGSVRFLTDSAGNVTTAQSYDAFGVTAVISGTGTTFGYTGQRQDPTGLVYLRARFYDPATGRFLTPDPIKPGLSYRYASNNPHRNFDPSGLDDCVFGNIYQCAIIAGPLIQEEALSAAGLGPLVIPSLGQAIVNGVTVAIGVAAVSTALASLPGSSLTPTVTGRGGPTGSWYIPTGHHENSASRRGWTPHDIENVLANPSHTYDSKNLANGNTATAYCDSGDRCVVVDNGTGEVIQTEDRNDPGWIHDKNFGPKKPPPPP